ncbi:MAG: hypothetical protein MK226_05560 [Saprospiraceae bacterium]|nr:hypothetical protein [Saprospiraceae bacterium]
MRHFLIFACCGFLLTACLTTKKNSDLFFTLSGNNPFWSAEISKEGIIFEELGREKVHYPYVKGETSNDRTIYLSSKKINGEKNWLKITLIKKTCQENLAGTKKFPYQVEIEKDGRTFYGCGKD